MFELEMGSRDFRDDPDYQSMFPQLTRAALLADGTIKPCPYDDEPAKRQLDPNRVRRRRKRPRKPAGGTR